MDIDSVGPAGGGSGRVGASHGSSPRNVASTSLMAPLHLEIPGQDMMDVEPFASPAALGGTSPSSLQSPSSPTAPAGDANFGAAGHGTRSIPPAVANPSGSNSPSVAHAGAGISNFGHGTAASLSSPLADASGAVGLRPVPTPPVVVVTKSDVGSFPKLKLHELFVHWLLKPENTTWLNSLLEDLRSGKISSQAIRANQASPVGPASPASPVSRLIHTHIPFGGSHRGLRHPTSPGAQQQLSPSHAVVSGDIDIGRSCVDRGAGASPAQTPESPVRMRGDPSQSTTDTVRGMSRSPQALAADQQPDSLDSVADAIAGMKADSSEKYAPVPMDDVETKEDASAVVSSEEKSAPSGDAGPLEGKSHPSIESPDVARCEDGSMVGEIASTNASIVRNAVHLGKTPKESEADAASEEGADAMDAESSVAPTPSSKLPPRPSSVMNGSSGGSTPQRRRRELGQFYFPRGKDADEREKREWDAIQVFFAKYRSEKGGAEGVSRAELATIVPQTLSLPSYFAPIVFDRILLRSNEHGSSSAQPSSLGASGSGVEENGSATASMATDSPAMSIDSGARNSSESGPGGSSSAPAEEAAGTVAGNVITEAMFRDYYSTEARSRSREARLFHTLLPVGEDRNYLVTNDFKVLLRALLMCHQGLSFLDATPEFQLRYSETVVERVFFSCTRKHNGRLTLEDIKRSRLLDTLMMVDEEEDINRERKYFSYEHFYVLYCRFWELDTDHDLQIDREDLMRYGGHSLTYRIVDRIFGGYARRLDNTEHSGYMSYTDFIWFCLSEEDKNSETAIDYWYRCIDMDGDGLITMYDMEYFYREQLHRMECFGHEPVQVRDILCQLLDMVKPNCNPPQVKRSDLKGCRLAGNFFNVLFNLNKFFALEARDPLQIRQEHATPELTDWDRFAALEYLRLSAEEEGEEDESWEDVGEAPNPLIVEAPF